MKLLQKVQDWQRVEADDGGEGRYLAVGTASSEASGSSSRGSGCRHDGWLCPFYCTGKEVAPPQLLLRDQRASRALVPSPERRWLRRNSSWRRHRSALAVSAPSSLRSATPSSPSRCLSPTAFSVQGLNDIDFVAVAAISARTARNKAENRHFVAVVAISALPKALNDLDFVAVAIVLALTIVIYYRFSTHYSIFFSFLFQYKRKFPVEHGANGAAHPVHRVRDSDRVSGRTAKSVVYGLEVVFLELFIGKRAIFKNDNGGVALISVVEYLVTAIMAGELEKILDEKVGRAEMVAKRRL
nr:putative serine/threonine-protein kinase-like protein CCR3 [Ipomoea batatas]